MYYDNRIFFSGECVGSIAWTRWIKKDSGYKQQKPEAAPFVERPVQHLSSEKMIWSSKLFQVVARCISMTFTKYLFESALRKEQWAAPFIEYLALKHISGKTREKCNVWHFVRSIDNCYHWSFPKVVLLKCSTKSTLNITFP